MLIIKGANSALKTGHISEFINFSVDFFFQFFSMFPFLFCADTELDRYFSDGQMNMARLQK